MNDHDSQGFILALTTFGELKNYPSWWNFMMMKRIIIALFIKPKYIICLFFI